MMGEEASGLGCFADKAGGGLGRRDNLIAEGKASIIKALT